MGTINVISKWNLKENKWENNPKYREWGRAFAFGIYDRIINDSSNKSINYIIVAYGSRVEDHSKNFINIKESEAGINKIINYFKNNKKNFEIKFIMMDADAPIKEEAKLLARHINAIACLPSTESINVIGLSKCGAMVFNTPKYFNNPNSFTKTNIYTVATPFEGTKLASPKIFYPEVKQLITSKLGTTGLANLVYEKLISVYEGISSNSHMDYDIAILGGIPEEKSQFYDETLIRDMFLNENLNAITQLNAYKNLVTGIDDKTLSESIRTLNLTGIGLCILDDLFFDEKSDGMVYVQSQRKVESVITDPKFKSNILTSSHHDVMSINRVANDILHIVDDTIEEQAEKVKYRSRKLN